MFRFLLISALVHGAGVAGLAFVREPEAALTHEDRAVVTVEENVIAGGAGSAVNEALVACGLTLPAHNIGLPDAFIEHGTREDCLEMAGLDAASLERSIVAFWRGQQPPRVLAAAGSSAG